MANVSSHSWRAAAAMSRPPPSTPDRGLPALDYGDESALTRIAPPRDSLVDLTRGRRRAGRAAWFAAGLLLGVLVTLTARGDADGPLRATRAWVANSLRSVTHGAPAAAPTATPLND